MSFHFYEWIAVNCQLMREGAPYCNLLCDVAEILDVWLQSPVPFVFVEKWVLVEKAVERQRLFSFSVLVFLILTQNKICTYGDSSPSLPT